MNAVREAIENMETVDGDDLFGTYEIRQAELARLLKITPQTITNWVRADLVPVFGEFSLGRGRPQRTFDLEDVYAALDELEGYDHYIPALVKEISKRQERSWAEQEAANLAIGSEETVEVAEISQHDVLIDRIYRLESLVVGLAAKLQDGEPLSGDESREILDIVFRRFDVGGS